MVQIFVQEAFFFFSKFGANNVYQHGIFHFYRHLILLKPNQIQRLLLNERFIDVSQVELIQPFKFILALIKFKLTRNYLNW